MFHIRIERGGRSCVISFVGKAMAWNRTVVALTRYRRERNDPASGRRQQPRCRSRHSRTVQAAAEMGTYIRGTTQPAFYRLIQMASQRLAIVFRLPQTQRLNVGLPMPLRGNTIRCDDGD